MIADRERRMIAVTDDDPNWPRLFEELRDAGKTDFILAILRAARFSSAELDAIERANRITKSVELT